MSQFIPSALCRFRTIMDGKTRKFLFECPSCKQCAGLSDDQWNGKISVRCDCGYHETHEYGKALVAAVTAHKLSEIPFQDS